MIYQLANNSSASLPTAGTAGELSRAQNSAPTVAAPSFASQFAVNYVAGRLYDATLGPVIRQSTEKVLGHKKTPAYKPPLTLSFLARDLAYSVSAFLLGQHAFAYLSRGSSSAKTSILTTSAGVSGATAGSVAGSLTLGAVKSIAGQTFVMTGLFTMLDALFANGVGPMIENGVNKVLGKKRSATSLTNKDGTVPNSAMHTTVEQFSRNLVRNFCGGITYTLVLRTIGSQAASAIATQIGGPAGALIAGIATSLIASQIAGMQDQFFGQKISSLAQQGVRLVKKKMGKKLDPVQNGDVVPVLGDRVSGAARGVVVPFVTAVVGNQQSAFIRSITPGGVRNA